MKCSFLKQTVVFMKHYARCELSSKERFFAPLLFSATLLVMFNFSFGESIPRGYMVNIFVAEVFITLLFSLQLSFMRQFDLESEDNAFEVLRVSNVSYYALFLGKYFVSVISILCVVLPSVFLAWFFLAADLVDVEFSFYFYFSIFAALLGLSALGSLISALLQKLSGRELLYPLFFYPLGSPLFLLAQQIALFALEGKEIFSLLLVLLGLDLFYLVLALLLFDEIMT